MAIYSGAVSMKNTDDKYGAIRYEDSGRSYSVLCLPRNCIPNEIGEVRDVFVDGQLVSFEVETVAHNGKMHLVATNVISHFREQFIGDINTHGEASTLERWLVPGRNGFLRRANGWDVIYFESDPKNSYHRDNMARLRIGDYVWHQVKPRPTNAQDRDKFIATNLVFYSDAEQERFKQGDFRSDEPELVPESAPLISDPTIEIFKPAFRSKTILEIISEKKNAKQNGTTAVDR